MEASSVPKFGSFKPKVTGKQDSKHDDEQIKSAKATGYDHNAESRSRPKHNHGRHRHDTSKYRSRETEHRHDTSTHRSRETEASLRNHSANEVKQQSRRQRPSNPDPPQLAAVELEESNYFVVDRRGDAKNAVYGSLHRYSVPSYRRTGYGNVVGTSRHFKIDREASDEKSVTLMMATRHGTSYQKVSRLLSSKYGRSNETKLRFVTAQSVRQDTGREHDFIEVQRSRKRKRGDSSDDGDDDDERVVDYRSIEGKAKASEIHDDDDVEIASSDDNLNGDLELRIRQENAVLSKLAKVSPTSLDAWLSLARHQDKLVRPGVEVSSLTNSERRTLADLKLSIYNEASKYISKGHSSREYLIVVIIREGRLIWDKTKLASRWKEALAECPTSTLLWTEYLDYIQDGHAAFRFEACKQAYVDCLKILEEAHGESSEDRKADVNKIQFYVLLRLTTLIREAGYEELAIAIWQALLELYFFGPSAHATSVASDRLVALEEFWESEVARIGEQGSLGWATYYGLGLNAQRKSYPSIDHTISASKTLQGFAAMEDAYERTFLLPASTSDDGAVTDPFRCVMFTDMNDVINPLSTNLPPLGIIESFAHFMGLPPVSLHPETAQACAWQRDPHLASGGARNGPVSATLQHQNVSIPSRREIAPTLFEDAFDAFKTRVQQTSAPENCIRFVDRILDSILATDLSNEILAEYYIAFKAKLLPAEMAKTSKRILKGYSSSLRLYNAFALAEASMEQMVKAMEIWSTALSMRSRVRPDKQHDVVYLWHGRLLAQVKSGDDQGGLQLLLTLAEIDNVGSQTTAKEGPVQHARQLRVQRQLEEEFDRTRLGGNWEHSALCADLLAWLLYLSSNYNIDLALKIYAKYSSRLAGQPGLLAMEQLHQCKARLVRTHLQRRRTHKPLLLQQDVEDSLDRFPNNSILLELHASLTAQDRIRVLLREQKAKGLSIAPSVVQWSFKIADEIRRSTDEITGSNSSTVRATFSKALLQSDSNVSHSPALWTAWLRYECGAATSSRGPEATQRTKRVFLDGLRHLPWLKSWVVQGMKLFGDGTLSNNELRQVYEGLNEKGLRIRVDIEDHLL